MTRKVRSVRTSLLRWIETPSFPRTKLVRGAFVHGLLKLRIHPQGRTVDIVIKALASRFFMIVFVHLS
jgi:hypothetical protein